MDKQKRKDMIQAYKLRQAEMGIIQIKNKLTGDQYVTISRDTQADMNSHRFKLNANWHPNKELQSQWKEAGEVAFEFSVVELLEYDETTTNHTELLEEMLQKHMTSNKQSKRLDHKKD